MTHAQWIAQQRARFRALTEFKQKGREVDELRRWLSIVDAFEAERRSPQKADEQ